MLEASNARVIEDLTSVTGIEGAVVIEVETGATRVVAEWEVVVAVVEVEEDSETRRFIIILE